MNPPVPQQVQEYLFSFLFRSLWYISWGAIPISSAISLIGNFSYSMALSSRSLRRMRAKSSKSLPLSSPILFYRNLLTEASYSRKASISFVSAAFRAEVRVAGEIESSQAR